MVSRHLNIHMVTSSTHLADTVTIIWARTSVWPSLDAGRWEVHKQMVAIVACSSMMAEHVTEANTH